ncbi:hypothetical protein AZE42_10395 [Rhizopogon vesiculosus]|uniref:Uncharacterized protein n=1 Tax=Rhizopogon vesiculosus TaxID=180088 RepID=A0A1J8PUN5_9AGAM|nr:hypothetical protein AZE42_10395 [Rhizopogon vesiculosus]
MDEGSFDNGERSTGPDESVMPDPPDKEVAAEECNEQEVYYGEQTVVLKVSSSSPPEPILAGSNTPPETHLLAHLELPAPAAVPPGSARKPKVRMNSEIERIVVIILILPSRKHI